MRKTRRGALYVTTEDCVKDLLKDGRGNTPEKKEGSNGKSRSKSRWLTRTQTPQAEEWGRNDQRTTRQPVRGDGNKDAFMRKSLSVGKCATRGVVGENKKQKIRCE